MNCSCGDPSCGYCQADMGSHRGYFAPFPSYLPTIYEEPLENSNSEIVEEDYDDVQEMDELEREEISEETSETTFSQLQISEDEKKRLRNTEAARRCREKIKKRTEELEEDLAAYLNKNDMMNQQRIRFLSQIEEQIRMLDTIKVRHPHLAPSITSEARIIVDKYKNSVASKRKALADYYAKSCNRNY